MSSQSSGKKYYVEADGVRWAEPILASSARDALEAARDDVKLAGKFDEQQRWVALCVEASDGDYASGVVDLDLA